MNPSFTLSGAQNGRVRLHGCACAAVVSRMHRDWNGVLCGCDHTLQDCRCDHGNHSHACSAHSEWGKLQELPVTAFEQLAGIDAVFRDNEGKLCGMALQRLRLMTLPCGGHALGIALYVKATARRLIDKMDAFDRFDDRRADRTDSREAMHRHAFGDALEILLRDNAQFKQMQKELANPHLPLGLGNILEKIEASPDLPETLQPVGFAKGIHLHRYQRQTLKWMCDAEDTQLRDKLWICINRKVRHALAVHGRTPRGELRCLGDTSGAESPTEGRPSAG